MTTRRITEALILAGIVFYVAWDIYANMHDSGGATISEVTVHFLYLHAGICAIVGALLGHLTWPRGVIWPPKVEMILALCTGAVLLAVDLLHVIPPVVPAIPFVVGYGIGHFVWPQSEWMEKHEF